MVQLANLILPHYPLLNVKSSGFYEIGPMPACSSEQGGSYRRGGALGHKQTEASPMPTKQQKSVAYKEKCTTLVEGLETPRGKKIVQSNLVSAYRATDYVIFSDGRSFSVRVGHHSPIIDNLLTRMKTRNGAFITACNPHSKSQSAGTNTYLDRALKRYLTARGFAYLLGEGRGEVGEWPPEASVLALGLSRVQATSIGRRFRQNAIVYVQLGRRPELVSLRWLG